MSPPQPQSTSAVFVSTLASNVWQALDFIPVHYYGFPFVVHGGVYLVFELVRSSQISPYKDYLSLLFEAESMCS